MLQSITGNSFLFILILVFIAVVLLLEGLFLLWQSYRGAEFRKIEKRMQSLEVAIDHAGVAPILKRRMLSDVPAIERVLLALPRAQSLHKLMHQAGVDGSVSQLLLTCAVAGSACFVLLTMVLHQPPLFGALFAGICAAAPLFYVAGKRRQRFATLEQQLPDALDLIIRAVRAGHAFPSALKMVGEEMPDPVAGEFRIVHDEVNFGVSLHQALMNLSERVPLIDLRYFVVAVMIQRESGGNLTEILGNLSRLIRDRLKLLARVRVLSSEGRLSAWVLVIMPFALAGIMHLVNTQFMALLWTDPIGIAIIQYMLSLMAVGVLIIRKIIRIRV